MSLDNTDLQALKRVAAAAEKFAQAADKAAESIAAIVSQLDEIRREVTRMAQSGETQ